MESFKTRKIVLILLIYQTNPLFLGYGNDRYLSTEKLSNADNPK